MKIGIIGSGNVGGTLGTRWAQTGHTVTFGTRKPESAEMKELMERAGTTARAASSLEAAHSSDVLLLATPWEATREIVESLGDLTGKVLVDAVNPLLPDLSGLAVEPTTSAGELVAQWARGARVVKCFNTVGKNVMANPKFGSQRAVMFYCGDDAAAKGTVTELAEELGFDAVDAGPLKQARVLEHFAMLWVSMAYVAGFGHEIAFQFLRR
ncbi:MAG TPA: NADPH-dependent F420 reductase [Candidatus Sulfopaludibacter sp.]|nr:NADPH-dependent F420 reductase [Candidatus Sulfopaludibacter sp.]